jgi:predicted Fe-Mo cluster-binding NifX family protein
MKIAVSSSGNNLNALVDPRFGRCPYFLIVDADSMNFEVHENQSASLGSGAGVQAAQFVASKGAASLITGNCGPKAMQVLSAAGIKVFLGQSGVVDDVLDAYKNDRLTAASAPNVAAHAGMGGMGMGRGSGRGMGRGQCRGRGPGQATG